MHARITGEISPIHYGDDTRYLIVTSKFTGMANDTTCA
jgi:hypothetical protein